MQLNRIAQVVGMAALVAACLLLFGVAMYAVAWAPRASAELVSIPSDNITYFVLPETSITSAGITTVGAAQPLVGLHGQSSMVSFEICNSDTTAGANTSGGAVSDLDVYVRFHEDAALTQWIDSTEFAAYAALGYMTEASQRIKFVSGTGVHEVDTGGCAYASIKVPPVYELQFRAASDRNTTGITIRGSVGFD